MIRRRITSRRGRFVQLSNGALKGLAKAVKLHVDRTLVQFLRGYKSKGKAPYDSVQEVLEKLNSIYWNDMSLGQREKGFLRDLHDKIKKESQQAPPPADPKRPSRKSPGKMTLDEIKRRQKQRRSFVEDLKTRLIKLGSDNKSLRPHIRPVLAELEREAAGTLRDMHEQFAMQIQEMAAKEAKGHPDVADSEADVLGSLSIDLVDGTEWMISVSVQTVYKSPGILVQLWKDSSKYDNRKFEARTSPRKIAKEIVKIVTH